MAQGLGGSTFTVSIFALESLVKSPFPFIPPGWTRTRHRSSEGCDAVVTTRSKRSLSRSAMESTTTIVASLNRDPPVASTNRPASTSRPSNSTSSASGTSCRAAFTRASTALSDNRVSDPWTNNAVP